MFGRIKSLFRPQGKHVMGTLPSQEFLASFATPPAKPECCGHPTGHWSTCHAPEAYLADAGGDPLVAQVAQVVQEIRMGRVPLTVLTQMRDVLAQSVGHHETRTSVDLDWAQIAEDSLTHRRIHVPTGAEFDAAEAAAALDFERIVAARVESNNQAKRNNVRVYSLAQDCGVSSKFLRGVLDHQFGIATKSPSSTVTAQQADEVREFFYAHTDV